MSQRFRARIPATTALRVLWDHAGGPPLSEALLFVLAGGIGAGVFAFRYEKEDFSSFFVAGRHLWQDDLAYLLAACGRLGVTPVVTESSGAKTGEAQLREALAHGPVIAWVDAAGLPHRAMPESSQGGGYHVVVIYSIDDDAGMARVGDLTDEPVAVPLAALAKARLRIAKQKNRLLRLAGPPANPDLPAALAAGLRSGADALIHNRMRNFTLEAFKGWAEQLAGRSKKESWEAMFPPGHNLWRALTSVHDFLEHYGTGGGLCRPIFAEGLAEAAGVLGKPGLTELAERYTALGREWSALADAALPDSVPAFVEAKTLLIRKAELLASGEAAAPEEIRGIWSRLAALGREPFPLDAGQAADLRAELARRVRQLYEREIAAREALAEVVAAA